MSRLTPHLHRRKGSGCGSCKRPDLSHASRSTGSSFAGDDGSFDTPIVKMEVIVERTGALNKPVL
jgi:hypothetical protein